jgi:hypothetical protein
MLPMLPTELIDKIVLLTNDLNVAYAIEDYISQSTFEKLEKNILIFGQVQGGKTNKIIEILQSKKYENEIKVLVVQNSLLVIEQYIQRLKSKNIEYQIVTKDIKTIEKKVILLLNNCYRYDHFKKIDVG